MKPQVDKNVYFSPNYINVRRFGSYATQLSEIMELKPANVLEIGIGNGMVSYMLKKAGVNIVTLDLHKSLEADIVASVTKMPLSDNTFDVVACYEILEHIPFKNFEIALQEIARVTKRNALISIPARERFYKVEFTLPKIGRRGFSFSLPFLRTPKHHFDGEHYWEIGTRNYPLAKILKIMTSVGFTCRKTYRIWENPYHRMFVLEKKK